MRAALALGRRSMGVAAPNPSVGAIVVKDGNVLGRGVTAPGGRPHAEPIALAQAGDGAQGATLYVTLEPCSHHGHTPPCVEAVLAAGIARVVVAIRDPDPRVAGRGLGRLREAGLDVREEVCRSEAHRDHRGHILRVTVGRPAVTLKMAETADGIAAGLPGGERLLITGAIANGRVQMMRANHDAVMVGVGTAVEDDPLLTCRLPGLEHRRPLRVVLDPRLRLSPDANLVRTAHSTPLTVFTGPETSEFTVASLMDRGVAVGRVATAPGGGLDLRAVLTELGRRGVTRVLCEGGPHLASALIDADLADEIAIFTAPHAFGPGGRAGLSPGARARIEQSGDYIMRDEGQLGSDRLRCYERRDASCSQG